MAGDLTSVAAVEELLGEPLVDPELRKVTTWIRKASALIRQPFPGLDERVSTGVLDPEIPAGIATEMVVRALYSDRIGYRVRSEGFPEVQTAYRDTDEPMVFLLAAEVEQLAPAGILTSAFTIRGTYQ